MLTALGDPRSEDVARAVASYLRRRAEGITDPVVRERFLSTRDCGALASVSVAARTATDVTTTAS